VIPPAITVKKLIILFRQHQYEDIESLQGKVVTERERERESVGVCVNAMCFYVYQLLATHRILQPADRSKRPA